MKLRKPALKMDSVKIASKIVFFRSFFFCFFYPIFSLFII